MSDDTRKEAGPEHRAAMVFVRTPIWTDPAMLPQVVTGQPMQSPELGQLGAALAKAQAAIGTVSKDRKAKIESAKGSYGYTYANLADVWDVIREPLSSNGLAIVQQAANNAQGVTVTTTLLHVSGEFIRDRCWMAVGDSRPQSLGSAITYARRYSLSSLVGVATAEDDDDGKAASAPPFDARLPPRQKQAQAPNVAAAMKKHEEEEAAKMRRARFARLYKRAAGAGATEDGFRIWTERVLGEPKTSAQFTDQDVSKLEGAVDEYLRHLNDEPADVP